MIAYSRHARHDHDDDLFVFLDDLISWLIDRNHNTHSCLLFTGGVAGGYTRDRHLILGYTRGIDMRHVFDVVYVYVYTTDYPTG